MMKLIILPLEGVRCCDLCICIWMGLSVCLSVCPLAISHKPDRGSVLCWQCNRLCTSSFVYDMFLHSGEYR